MYLWYVTYIQRVPMGKTPEGERDEPKTACIRIQKKLRCISTNRKLLKQT